MKLSKQQLRRIIREAIEQPSTELEKLLSSDDAVDKVSEGQYEMYCDENNGQEELDYIIVRLKEIYATGGGVGKITIYDIRG